MFSDFYIENHTDARNYRNSNLCALATARQYLCSQPLSMEWESVAWGGGGTGQGVSLSCSLVKFHESISPKWGHFKQTFIMPEVQWNRQFYINTFRLMKFRTGNLLHFQRHVGHSIHTNRHVCTQFPQEH